MNNVLGPDSNAVLASWKGLTEKETGRLCKAVGSILHQRDTVFLEGPLGVGKTTAIRAFIRCIGMCQEAVPSPTFTFFYTYESAKGPIYHFDLYRLGEKDLASQEENKQELGLDEILYHHLCFVEWPQYLGAHAPKNALTMQLLFSNDKNKRDIVLLGGGLWQERLKGPLFSPPQHPQMFLGAALKNLPQ